MVMLMGKRISSSCISYMLSRSVVTKDGMMPLLEPDDTESDPTLFLQNLIFIHLFIYLLLLSKK